MSERVCEHCFGSMAGKRSLARFCCRGCKSRAVNRRWYEAEPEKKREAWRLWRESNPERKSETDRLWREANPERKSETDRLWQKANPEKKRETDSRWRERNRESQRDYARLYYNSRISAAAESAVLVGLNAMKEDSTHAND